MGQNMGQLISKFGENTWDIDIKNLMVSLIKQIVCTFLAPCQEDHVLIYENRAGSEELVAVRNLGQVVEGRPVIVAYFHNAGISLASASRQDEDAFWVKGPGLVTPKNIGFN